MGETEYGSDLAALGGIFDATVLGISLTYVTVRTEGCGILKIPNSVMLATAAGPLPPERRGAGRGLPPALR